MMNILKKGINPPLPVSKQEEVQYVPNCFCLRHCPDGHNLEEEFPREEYSLLFVLQGAVEVLFRGAGRHLEAGQFFAFQNKALQSLYANKDTTLIIHYPPEEVNRYLAVCVDAFRMPSSQAMPILPSVARWIEGLQTELANCQGMLCSEDWERKLENALIGKPSYAAKYGEVYIAYYKAAKRFIDR